MQKRNQDESQHSPGLDGPDYFSLVIEWDEDPDRVAASSETTDAPEPERRPWDIVDEGSLESFPASDPPAWMGRAGHTPTGETEVVPSERDDNVRPAKRRRAMRISRIVVAAAAASVGAAYLIAHRLRHHAR